MLTSDLTEVLNYNSLILTANDVVEIEIGGDSAGNPAGGNNIDGFDQINVTGSGTVQLAGLLDVRLVNNYVPEIGRKVSVPQHFLHWRNCEPVLDRFRALLIPRQRSLL